LSWALPKGGQKSTIAKQTQGNGAFAPLKSAAELRRKNIFFENRKSRKSKN
jgi:hypothetical protein